MDSTNIVVVDSDINSRQVILNILQSEGYNPIAATTGSDALGVITKEKPALTLVNLKLRDMSGLELIQEIRKKSLHTECMLIAGHASNESIIESVNLGVCGFIQKPYDTEQLLSVIRRAVEKIKTAGKLKEGEEKYRAYIENAPNGIFVTDANGRYIDVNQAACLMTGYSRTELLTMSILDLVSPKSSPSEALKDFYELKAVGRAQTEIVVQRKDGTEFCSSLEAVALSDDSFMAFCSDISERKQAEEALKYRADFEGLITDISTRFMNLKPSTIDDEINNALQAIGELANVDRAYVFLFSADGSEMNNSHEWCAIGIEPQIENLQKLSVDLLPWWTKKVKQLEYIHIPKVCNLYQFHYLTVH